MFRAEDLTPVWDAHPGGVAVESRVHGENRAIAALSSTDTGIPIHDLFAGKPIALLQEHTGRVVCIRFSANGDFLATMATDNTVRIWRCRDWQCVATLERENITRTGGLAFHPAKPLLAIKDGSKVDLVRLDYRVLGDTGPTRTSRRYTNAKVVLVGDTGVGKSGLGLVLSGKPFAPTESTHGRNVWSFEKSYATLPSGDVQTRETLLWDLAGQPGYRMVHQLHLNEVAVALVVFDARSETDPFAGVQYWSRALAQARRLDDVAAVRLRVFLVAARADRGTAAVSQERIRATVEALGFDGYLETSAKEGWGVDDLVRSVRDGIDWDALPVVSSNELFEAIRDFVLEEKKQGGILSTVDDLARGFRRVQADAREVDDLADRFAVCIGRLESVGVVRRMSYGDYVLLRPELLDSYASSLVQAAKDEPDGLGFVKEDDALEGKFRIPEDERLTNPQQERILLNAVVQELLRREIALKEVTDREVDLIFPSQFTRERPDAPQLPGQDVVFTFDGHLYSIYSTLAVRLAHSRFFERDEMWHNSATYKSDAGRCGIAIREVEEGKGELALFYDEHVVPLVRKQFEAYVVEHLEQRAGEVTTRRVRACRACGYTIPDDLVRGRISRGKSKMTCPQCDESVIALVDEPDSVDVRPVVAEMNSNANAQRDQDVAATTLKGKREAGDYDVFLCHNVRDKPQVLRIAAALEERGILPWLDVHDIQPGSRWQQEMAKGIEQSRSAAVLIGPAGPGPWHEAEMELINDWSARNKSRNVIPVILDGTEEDPALPGFLRVWSTVDMRTADPDPIEQLVWGITGRHPRWD
jgi:GTPase SAR1 family protein